jgi:ABC-type polysaccharide/polyol phosphate transport system ATPase subunit
MQARPAFAMATCIEPGILLLDEGIGAGDASFWEKANERLDAFVAKAGILVLASHSLELVRRLCTKAVPMERGRVNGRAASTKLWRPIARQVKRALSRTVTSR